MAKPTRETIRKRVATRRRNAAIRERKRKARVHSSMGPELAAATRLGVDGAHSTDALQRRVRALAQERNIPAADVHKLMYKRPSNYSIMVFCKKYKVSYDWLLCGDLKGRLRMARNEFAPPVLDPWYEVGGLLRKLGDQKLLPAAIECMRVLLERRGTAS